MVNVYMTPKAQGVYDLLNGARKSINQFVDGLKKGKFTERNLTLLVAHSKLTLYSYKCESAYILLAKEDDNWYIVDILTEEGFQEFSKLKNS